MIPRGAPYISWADLAAAAFYGALPGDAHASRERVEAAWAPHTVACLSVRTGLDAIFSELAFAPGTEVLVSAITIPHILDILSHHQLVPVPVDVDLATLSVDPSSVRAAVTPKTKAILVAHLFGSRMPMDEIVAIAAEHELLLLEDCAQANDGSGYRGHSGSSVSLFSFGAIKRQTALGGALLRFRDPELEAKTRRRLASYPRQPRREYFRRLATMIAVKAVSYPWTFSAFVALCRMTGRDHDHVLGVALRGFSGGDLFVRLRRQPAPAMIRLLERRLRDPGQRHVARRVTIVETVTRAAPGLAHPGDRAAHHTHWLFPVLAKQPNVLMHELWKRGFDATQGASNLTFVPAPPERTAPAHAQQLMREVVYLPLSPSAAPADLTRLAAAMRELAGV